MPKAKRVKRTPYLAPLVSSELGDGDFAFKFDKKNGRAIRKCRSQTLDSPFEDSAVAISDPESDGEDIEVGDTIAVAPRTRKRKRSVSPLDAHLPSDPVDVSSSDSESEPAKIEDPSVSNPAPTGQTTVHLTVNIPTGHQGPITLQLDPSNISSLPSVENRKSDALIRSTLARANTRSKPKSKKKKYAGFLDLPAELRNHCYRAIFVTDKKVSFGKPDNFSRGGQLLRTCRQVYEEGRSILYSENTFGIERRMQRYGSFWEDDWRELGYLPVRKFMKAIGPANIGLIRHITMFLEDATPCLNPAKMTTEERRFVNDDDLISVLRHLGNHGLLQSLSMHFHGRRRVDRTDDRFLDYMKRIKADTVSFTSWPPATSFPRESKQDSAVKNMLLATCTRKRKKFD